MFVQNGMVCTIVVVTNKTKLSSTSYHITSPISNRKYGQLRPFFPLKMQGWEKERLSFFLPIQLPFCLFSQADMHLLWRQRRSSTTAISPTTFLFFEEETAGKKYLYQTILLLYIHMYIKCTCYLFGNEKMWCWLSWTAQENVHFSLPLSLPHTISRLLFLDETCDSFFPLTGIFSYMEQYS